MITITIFAHFSRIYFMNHLLKMKILNYVKQVILPISAVTVLAFVLPMLYTRCFDPSLWRIVGVCGVTVASSAIIIFFIGLTKSERNGLTKFVFSKIRQKKE
jgi:hypothetical protein